MYLRRRFFAHQGYRSSLKVVCVGNLHAGGTGKTPFVGQLARELGTWSPVLVSRGYGGRLSSQGAWVDAAGEAAWRDFGDEPVYLSRQSGRPVRIGSDRALSAREIEKRYPHSLILMDDGFQNFGLRHDLDIVVLPESGAWLDQYCHPAGTLRETSSALHSATATVIVRGTSGEGSDSVASVFRWKSFLAEFFPTLPVFEVRLLWGGLFLDGKAFQARPEDKFGGFCGIARPGRFISALQSHLSHPIKTFRTFADHHCFSDADLQLLNTEARDLGLSHWVTTEKDLVRLPSGIVDKPVLTARVEYEIPEALVDLIQQKLELA
jgi:tetraacyldisaccharide 4'-kinase